MGRKSQAKELLIEAARTLMQEKGYQAVGVAEICTAAGVRPGSFYYFFPTKQLLGVEVLSRHWEETRGRWSEVLTRGGGPLARVERLMNGLQRQHRDAKKSCGRTTGCLLGNMALERSTHDPDIQKCLRTIFTEQEEMVCRVLEEAARASELAEGVTPVLGAKAIVALMQGLVMQAKLHDDPRLLRGAGVQARRLVAA